MSPVSASLPRSKKGHVYVSLLARYRFFLLFLFLLGSLIFYPYAQTNSFLFVMFRVLGSGVILLSVYAISVRRGLVAFAVVLAVPALVRHNLVPLPDRGLLSLLNMLLSLSFDVFIIVIIFRRVFAHDKPNSETIFGALCIYLLTGFTFASLYGMISVLQPHAFYLDPQTNLHTHADRFDFIYYSFGSMTCLGAAGITAVSSQARSVTVIESVLGVLYLAVLIARLMGAYRPPAALS